MAWHTQPAPWQTLASYSAMFSTVTARSPCASPSTLSRRTKRHPSTGSFHTDVQASLPTPCDLVGLTHVH